MADWAMADWAAKTPGTGRRAHRLDAVARRLVVQLVGREARARAVEGTQYRVQSVIICWKIGRACWAPWLCSIACSRFTR